MVGWCALVPQKSLSAAKGRIRLPYEQRRAVATAMLRDTVAALKRTPCVDEVIVLWDDDADRLVLPDVEWLPVGGLGLNASLERGAAVARACLPGLGLVVVPGDLPALDPSELALALEQASRFCRAYLTDAAGTGTTILTATEASTLLPAYGVGSAAQHAALGACSLGEIGVETVRTDVDDLNSLAVALAMGCGRHTRNVCADLALAAEGAG